MVLWTACPPPRARLPAHSQPPACNHANSPTPAPSPIPPLPRHDAVSDYFTACLRWLEAGGRANLPTLLRQWTVPDGNLSALSMAAPFQPAAARRRL